MWAAVGAGDEEARLTGALLQADSSDRACFREAPRVDEAVGACGEGCDLVVMSDRQVGASVAAEIAGDNVLCNDGAGELKGRIGDKPQLARVDADKREAFEGECPLGRDKLDGSGASAFGWPHFNNKLRGAGGEDGGVFAANTKGNGRAEIVADDGQCSAGAEGKAGWRDGADEQPVDRGAVVGIDGSIGADVAVDPGVGGFVARGVEGHLVDLGARAPERRCQERTC
jgi:hypothetical protein